MSWPLQTLPKVLQITLDQMYRGQMQGLKISPWGLRLQQQ